MDTQARARETERVVLVILVFNVIVAAAKGLYGAVSGSLAVSSDALHSLLDSASNVVGFIALRIAARPPDADHPYGHEKVEILAAAVVGLLIAGGAVRFGWNAIEALAADPTLPDVGTSGFVIMAGTLAVNLFVAWWERRRGNALGSQFLVADAAHTSSDVLVTIGVIISLACTRFGIAWADPVGSLAVLVVIGFVGWRIISTNVNVLIDRVAIDPGEVTKLALGVGGVLGVHRVRSRGVGGTVHIDLHLVLDAEITLRRAHEISHEVERRIRAAFSGVRDVTIHMEPAGEPEEDL